MGTSGKRSVGNFIFFFGVTTLVGVGAFLLVYWKLGGPLDFMAKQEESTLIQTSKKPMVKGASRGICNDGFRYFRTTQFALCYPERLVDIVEKQSPTQTQIIFTEGDEKLMVGLQVEKDWGPHMCNSEEDIQVASYSAVRTVFRADRSAGCGGMHGFATLIKTGEQESALIRMAKNEGTYQNLSEYLSIEQSFRLYEEPTITN